MKTFIRLYCISQWTIIILAHEHNFKPPRRVCVISVCNFEICRHECKISMAIWYILRLWYDKWSKKAFVFLTTRKILMINRMLSYFLTFLACKSETIIFITHFMPWNKKEIKNSENYIEVSYQCLMKFNLLDIFVRITKAIWKN